MSPKYLNERMRVLLVEKILFEETGPESPISTEEIVECLASMGVTAERKAIYGDIEALKRIHKGFTIVFSRGKNNGWFVKKEEDS